MPALRLFRRRWLLADDDVAFIMLFLMVFHVVWVAMLIGWLADVVLPIDCTGMKPFTVAASCLLGSLAVTTALEAACVAVSMRGGMFERSKRRALPPLIYACILGYAAQVASNVVLTVLLYDRPPRCPAESDDAWDPVDVLWWLVWTTWTVIIGLALLGAVVYNAFPDYDDPASWERRYMCVARSTMCCCDMGAPAARQRQSGRAARVGATLASLFGHMDLTLTDTVTAFCLALHLQQIKRAKQERYRAAVAVTAAKNSLSGASAAVEPAPPSAGDVTRMERGVAEEADCSAGTHIIGKPVDAATLDEGALFCAYAFAAYGWALYVLQRGAMALPDLCCAPGCTQRLSTKQGVSGVVGEARMDREAALRTLGCAPKDLLFQRMEGERPDALSYLIAVDRGTKSVVLAIRGAMSVDDNVRDLLLEPADLDAWVKGAAGWGSPPPPVRPPGEDTHYAAQSGYLEAAAGTLADVQRTGVLQQALEGPTAEFAGYRLVVTGHSLGAGCAFLVALRLRRLLPTLRCWCFSPPGGLATAELGAAAAEWCTTVVCGHEWAPRLSLPNIDRLRDEMMLAAARCRQPKASVAAGWVWGKRWAEADLFHAPDAIPAETLEVLEKYYAGIDGDVRRRQMMTLAGRFSLPGRVAYMRQREPPADAAPGGCCAGEPERSYFAEWVAPGEVLDKGLILSARMNADHMPNYHLEVIRRVAAEAQAREAKAAAAAGGGGAPALATAL